MITRLLPERFLETFTGTAGPLSGEFVETYELLCEALYWGVRSHEHDGRSPGKGGYRPGYWFGDDSLLSVKARADKYLSETAKAIRRWQGKGSRRRAEGSAKARRVDLPGAWRKGHRAKLGGKEAS